jgi:serine/threonine protein kinase
MGQIGRYETVNQLGAGAMGTVYRAHDTLLDREVALKIIRTGAEVDPQVRARFYREARACARLQHPNIIAVYDLGEAENMAFIAMELLTGSDFRKIIQERRVMPVEAKISIIAQICDAVAHAHRHGVIHRDIKPSNLFLTDDKWAKVLDFGIARLPSSRLTVAGQILGTPNYMAPEQILSRPSDGRADLFSLGVVFFELLTFAHPFQGPLIPRRIAQDQPDSLFDHDSTLPVILEEIMAKALAKDPDQRYQTVDQFATDLRTLLDALKQNASPTFSRFELPSRRPVPGPATSPDQRPVSYPVPAGQDPDEWRLSEALRLLPELESAIERKDLPGARAIFAELEGRLSGDVRFSETLRLNRSRLEELGNATMTIVLDPSKMQQSPSGRGSSLSIEPPPPSPPAPRPAAPAPPPDRPFAGIDEAVFPINKRPVDPTGNKPPDAARPAPEIRPAPQPARQPASQPATPEVKPAPAPAPVPVNKRAILVAGAVLCTLLILLVLFLVLRPVTVEPAVAAATVHDNPASIYTTAGNGAEPGSGNKVIGVASPGSKLNVVALPTPQNPAWTKVQALEPNVLKPGYVLTSALRDWHGNTGPAALTLVKMLTPQVPGSDEEFESQVRQYADVIARYPDEPAAKDARLEIIRLRLLQARHLKDAGSLPETWEPHLQAVQQQIEALRSDPSFRDKIAVLDTQIRQLRIEPNPAPNSPQPAPGSHTSAADSPVPPQPVPPVSPAAPRVNIAALLADANTLRDNGDLLGADQKLQQVLQADPYNSKARALRDLIKKARDAEK